MDSPGFDALPRGRHQLTREQVAASQRQRLLQGITEVVAEKGYVHTSVADVLKRAHVSRETFYEHFTDKQDCFLAAFETSAELLLGAVTDAVGPPELPALERFDQVLTHYLDGLAADSARARTFLLEVYAAGPAAASRRHEIQRQFVQLMLRVLLDDRGWRDLPDPEFAAQMVVGGVAAMVTGKVAAGDHAALPGLRGPIMAHVRSLMPGSAE
ncbi:TetR/AcrR family transcriptional regulator [Actinomadura barringtoniae]|uniref:TetR/AcrR family transcriptional regulator n=1 Tax=Actinomadura barringtoniae TaxID=1427535 RepID=A0A939PN30_9ACTN|nr:TetR/AcrR family transcriptional regulator [Actinomadura barringtoniae]MBO2452939.1 TetR/AcrR family transcriptional regulator [Actinomadura barringtoniae]